MILIWLILIPLFGGLLAWVLGRLSGVISRVVALLAAVVDLVLAASLLGEGLRPSNYSAGGTWIASVNAQWIPQLGIRFHLAMDGFSLWLVLLSAFLGIVSVLASWSEVRERVGFFHMNLLLSLAGVIGVFLAMDLFLFTFFFELMLVPMYFLIVLWGDVHRRYAATKFFIFTQVSGLLMVVAIVELYNMHGEQTGIYSFDYSDLLQTRLSDTTAWWLMLGFLAALLVKMAVVPLHSWLPDAYASAPTAGSIVLAGLMSKAGAYGLIRFVFPFFPNAAAEFAHVAMILAVIGIVYGAIMAFGQTDIKRLIAYSSVSHLGFVLLGVFAWNPLSLQGAILQMICHGLSVAGLFVLAGVLQERLGTRDMDRMGGFWAIAPRMGAVGMFFALASLGLPGLGNFVGEFLVLVGTFKTHPVMAALSTLGFVLSVAYSLRMIQAVFHGGVLASVRLPDMRRRELSSAAALMLLLIWLGIYPLPVMDTVGAALQGIQTATEHSAGSETNPSNPGGPS